MIPAGHQYAVSELAKLELSAARRLELARMFDITGWIRPALADIILKRSPKKLRSITNDDRQRMTEDAYIAIAKALEAIQVERGYLALRPPPLQISPSCRTHAACQVVWPKIWFDLVAPRILNRVEPVPITDLPWIIRGIPSGKMEILCLLDTARAFENNSVLQCEEIFVDQVTEVIKEMYFGRHTVVQE